LSWKKYFRPVNSVLPSNSIGSENSYATVNKYNNWLPEIYEGPTDRLQRYQIYATMDLDHEVHAALDTIADFSTENDIQSKKPFVIKYHEDPSPKEVGIIDRVLKQWCTLNEFDQRLWKMFRATLMYGDQFFIRDPETYKLFWCDPNKVTKVVVNESEGKKIESYYIKDLDLNIGEMVATSASKNGPGGYNGGNTAIFAAPMNGAVGSNTYSSGSALSDGKFGEAGEIPVAAEHVVHITLCDGMTGEWPFGTSILEYVYKVYKQKELLEDSILIYRVHRAPERRVFFIDVGSMPPNKAQQYLERVKYEVQQKRIPSRDGGGQSVVDSAYNPMSSLEDYFFATTPEGRGSKVETLPGGDNLGDIDDLRYFNNKVLRALAVPSSYLPSGPEDGSAGFNDGRVGTAFIQEFRFSKVCERYQKQLANTFDKEFKLFLKKKGVQIDSSLFSVEFPEPQSFSEYRQLELDSAKINTFAAMAEVPYLSKRFALKRYLGLTEAEISENEKLWQEEKGITKGTSDDAKADLSSAGITSSSIETMAPEDGFDEETADEGEDISDADIDEFGDDTMDDET
jgi:hypothetical protein